MDELGVRGLQRGAFAKVLVWPSWSYVYSGFYPVMWVDVGDLGKSFKRMEANLMSSLVVESPYP